MAPVAYGEFKVNISTDERNGCDESRNGRLLRKVGLNPGNTKAVIVVFFRKIWEVGINDPRSIIHAMKVALALSLVSLVFLLNPLFVEVGDNAIWAVMTVVVVLEFTAGATLSKGLNRGIGTAVSGSLGFFVCYLSEQVGQGEAFVVGSSMFVIGAAATYARFLPFIKKRYDYGVVVFLLTFSLITVSGYRVHNILRMAYGRLSTILIGCGVCFVVSLIVFPIWAGEDLHNSTVKKFQGLEESLLGCVREYFDGSRDDIEGDESKDPIYQGYRSVLDSKASDESLATFASWEPRHGPFRYRHPWKQYVKIGAKLRYLAYSVVGLHGCLRSDIQIQQSVRSVIKNPCNKVGEEAARLLSELSCSIQQMTRCDWQSTMKQLKIAVKDLHAAFSGQRLFIHSTSWPLLEYGRREGEDEEFSCDTKRKVLRRLASWHGERDDKKGKCIDERSISRESVEFGALHLAAFAWVLVEIVGRVEHVAEAVDELATLADFKPCNPSPATANYNNKLSSRIIPEIHIPSNYAE